MIKKSDFNCARFFKKRFRSVDVFHVNYGRELQIRDRLMTDTIYNKRDTLRFCYGFRIKLMVSMALTYCLRRIFLNFLRFVSFLMIFVVQ